MIGAAKPQAVEELDELELARRSAGVLAKEKADVENLIRETETESAELEASLGSFDPTDTAAIDAAMKRRVLLRERVDFQKARLPRIEERRKEAQERLSRLTAARDADKRAREVADLEAQLVTNAEDAASASQKLREAIRARELLVRCLAERGVIAGDAASLSRPISRVIRNRGALNAEMYARFGSAPAFRVVLVDV